MGGCFERARGLVWIGHQPAKLGTVGSNPTEPATDQTHAARAGDQTMYGYSTYGETSKQTLESGDIAGIEAIYGP